jgi:hypothetical protein
VTLRQDAIAAEERRIEAEQAEHARFAEEAKTRETRIRTNLTARITSHLWKLFGNDSLDVALVADFSWPGRWGNKAVTNNITSGYLVLVDKDVYLHVEPLTSLLSHTVDTETYMVRLAENLTTREGSNVGWTDVSDTLGNLADLGQALQVRNLLQDV